MGWTDKYKCEHDYEKVGDISISWDYSLIRQEVKCTKCGNTTQIDADYVNQFLAAREPKPIPETVTAKSEPNTEDKPDVFKEIFARTPPIPDSAISYIDGDAYVDTMYATTIVEQAILNSGLITAPDYGNIYVSLGDLCEILDFIDKL